MFSVIGRVSVRGWNSLYSIKTMPMENPYKDSKIQCVCVCVCVCVCLSLLCSEQSIWQL